jgi:hypothetical protein
VPTTSIPAPPTGAFNVLTFAAAQVKDESTPRRAWESRLGTVPPTPPACHCAMLCDMASNNPVALCHPLPYGRRAAPSKKDGGALEGKTDDYATPAQGQHRDVGPAGPVTSIAISPVWPSPPSQHHPGHCITIPNTVGGGATRRRHTGRCAPCGLSSATPSNRCTDDDQTGDPYTATLETAPGRIQGTP